MLALNRLSVRFAHGVKRRMQPSLISSPVITVELGDAKGFQQGFELEKCRVFVIRQHLCQYFSCAVVDGVPQPTRLPFGLHKAPHLVHFCFDLLPLTQLDDGLSRLNLG